MLPGRINQSSAQAQGDIVGGNKTSTFNHNYYSTPAGRVERYMQLLEHEMNTSIHTQVIIDGLQFYYNKAAPDGIVGLEAKLEHAARQDELFIALEKKELFVKLLYKYEMYASAQRLFAYLLSKAESEFNSAVHPSISDLSRAETSILISERIINPIVNECGFGPLDINHNIVMGMIYWLAEQCFVRWHQ
ncbi:ABC-three component system protein [Methylobacterium indicum]|uniref:ABC-three component system protein n=1 Tax=Methylobacterium indicum TaxID=1775910 RepID=UPI000AE38F0C|nr:ABC-three component system protein [Methylobacterium indicum]